jgi:hypothetical protein
VLVDVRGAAVLVPSTGCAHAASPSAITPDSAAATIRVPAAETDSIEQAPSFWNGGAPVPRGHLR